MAFILGPETNLPWQSSAEDDERFQRILRRLLVAAVVLGLIVPFIPVPEPSREAQRELPPHLARVILEQEPPPPPPEPEPEPEPQPEPEPAPEPEPEVEQPPEPPPAPEPEPEPPTQTRIEQARETAARSGLLQHSDELAALRQSMDTRRLETPQLVRAETRAAEPRRDVLAEQTARDSGGIATGQLSREIAGGELEARDATRVEDADEARAAREETARAQPGERPQRSDEQIRQVIDQHMGAIFSIYNRALRQDPTLQGKLLVRLVIDPSGAISEATIISSELNDPALEQRLLARILLITFPADNVAVTRVNYTFDFLPR